MKRRATVVALACMALMLVFCTFACAEQVQGEYFKCDMPDGWTYTTANSGWWIKDAETGASILFMESYVPGFSGISRQEWPAHLADLMNEPEEDIDFNDCLCKASAGKLGWHSATADGKTTNKIYFGITHNDTTLMAGCEWTGDQSLKEEIVAIFRSVDYVRSVDASPAAEPTETASGSFETDYSSMSLAELIDARQQIQQAMWETDEWQSVEVPEGIYQIGVDIPAGHWSISAAVLYPTVEWGISIDEYGVSIEESIDKMSLGDGKRVDWNLTEGTYIHVRFNPVVFTPYTGKPDLGFK